MPTGSRSSVQDIRRVKQDYKTRIQTLTQTLISLGMFMYMTYNNRVQVLFAVRKISCKIRSNIYFFPACISISRTREAKAVLAISRGTSSPPRDKMRLDACRVGIIGTEAILRRALRY